MQADGATMQRKTRTALILASVALAFFAGIVLRYWTPG
jgi:hypothetical protein